MASDVAQLTVHERLWAWFDTHTQQALIGVAAVIVIGFGVAFYFWRAAEKETAASEELSKLAATRGGEETTNLASAYLQVANRYSTTSAGARALLLAAANLFTEGKYSEARAQFERFLREYRASPLSTQAVLGVAACLDAEGKTDEAIKAYDNLARSRPNEPATRQAKFALARLYESQNKLEQARNLYQELAPPDARDSIGSEAGMRLEDLLAKHPNLAARTPTPMPTNAPQMILK